jgi:hypothetical protein
MRRIKALVLALVLLVAAVPVSAMECVPGMAFRDPYGNLLDCLEDLGSDCMRCKMIIIVS